MDYLITNPSKQVFIRLDNNGRPETCGREMAQKFESSKAKNIVDHLPKTLKRFHFRAQAIPEITPQINKNIVQEMEKNIIQGNVDYEVTENITQWLDKFGSCADVLNEAKERQKVLIQQLEDTDNKLLDLLHRIELESPKDLYHGWLLYKEIKINRKNRRVIKDELIIIQNVLEKTNSFWLSRERIQKAIDGLFKRKYRFRIVEEEIETECGVENATL